MDWIQKAAERIAASIDVGGSDVFEAAEQRKALVERICKTIERHVPRCVYH